MVTAPDRATDPVRRPSIIRPRLVAVALWALMVAFASWALLRVVGFESVIPVVQLLAFTPYVALASLPGSSAPTRSILSRFRKFTAQAQAALERAGLTDLLPNRVAFPVDGVTGSALYSRYPLTDGAFHVHEASGFGQAPATLTVPGASPIEVKSAHPCPPSGLSRSRCWRADLADQPPATVDGPVRLLIGDFNATLDHAALRRLIATGYRDAADVVGAGYARTWPYDEKWYIPAVAIDHVLADRRVGVTEVSVYPVLNSDHRAVFAALQLPPA